jgi:hypothetical protein
MSFEELKSIAMNLNIDQRAALARELLISLDVVSYSDAESLWIDEAMRRDDAIVKGEARLIPAGEVFARGRAARK